MYVVRKYLKPIFNETSNYTPHLAMGRHVRIAVVAVGSWSGLGADGEWRYRKWQFGLYGHSQFIFLESNPN